MLDLSVDVKENELILVDPMILHLLLQDKTTGKNLIWATDDYSSYGDGFQFNDEITVEKITGEYGSVIMPRSIKSKEAQSNRTRNMAEVFTPTWICNNMNNLVDEEWFGRRNVFNEENSNQWKYSLEKIVFPDYHQHQPRGWESYIGSKRLEITCGEAPYLVTRYDTVTGEEIPVEQRVGILDRKFRIINERTRMLKDRQKSYNRWFELAKKALQSTYGFEWQGDNVLLARENLLYTVIDYFYSKFGERLPQEWLPDLVKIISWNIWQMDGLKCVVPNSCHEYKKQPRPVAPSLFDARAYSASVLKRSVGLCDVNEIEIQQCQGCLKDNLDLHNGVYCKIKNWSTGRVLKFKDLMGEQRSEERMSKDFKFDVVIGNPPYQESISTGSNTSLSKQLFPSFVKNSILLGSKHVMLIMPSRWFTADAQDKSFIKMREFIKKHNHIKTMVNYPDGKDVFADVTAGSICFFLYDADYNGNVNFLEWSNGKFSSTTRPLFEDGLDIILSMNEMVSILDKVRKHKNFVPLTSITYGRNAFGIVGKKSILEQMSQTSPFDNAVKILCAYEEIRYTDKMNVTKNASMIGKWKAFTSKGNGGAGNLNKEKAVAILGKAFVGTPDMVCTDSLIPFGPFDTEIEAYNFTKYMTTKFLRFMVGILKVSQNLYQTVYQFVPLQDFSTKSDVDWSQSVTDIDSYLYRKYDFSEEEIAFIESMIKPMD